jgi:hypothetical protein
VGQVEWLFEKRYSHVLQTSLAPHSGHRFQFSFTGILHWGHAGGNRDFSQAGQNFQLAWIGSPQSGHSVFVFFSAITVAT